MKNIIRVFFSLNLVALTFLVLYTASVSNSSDSIDFKTFESNSSVIELAKKKEATLTFVGDVMLDRFVELRMKELGEDYPFASTSPIFEGSDAVIINLEGPIMGQRVTASAGAMQFSFATSVAPLLKKYGVTHASLANNHTLDKGREVFDFTESILEEYDIATFGNPTLVGTSSVHTERINNLDFTFIGLNETYGRLSIASSTELISKAKLEKSNTIIIVFIHWGEEYKLTHNSNQEKIAYALIDAGADVVIGHHPHVVQDIERYKGKLIFYSLGNFIFDQYFSTDTKSGLVLKMKVTEEDIFYDLIPIYAPRSNPSVMEGEMKDRFIQELFKRSDPELASEILIGRISSPR